MKRSCSTPLLRQGSVDAFLGIPYAKAPVADHLVGYASVSTPMIPRR